MAGCIGLMIDGLEKAAVLRILKTVQQAADAVLGHFTATFHAHQRTDAVDMGHAAADPGLNRLAEIGLTVFIEIGKAQRLPGFACKCQQGLGLLKQPFTVLRAL